MDVAHWTTHQVASLGGTDGLYQQGICLAWRPLHLAATQQMKMQVVDRLPAVAAAVHYPAVAVVSEAQLARQIADDLPHVADERRVGVGYVVERRDLLLGNQQHVRRRLRSNVAERQAE